MPLIHAEVVEVGKVEDFKDFTMVCGFPGPGLVGGIAAIYIIKALAMREVGHVRSRYLPPVAVFYGGVLRHPLRIYASEDKKLLVVVSEAALPSISFFDISNAILDWAEKKGARRVICLEGLTVKEKTGKAIFAAAEPEVMGSLAKYGVEMLEEGFVSGINGTLLNECLNRRIDGFCLFAETYPLHPDPEAAAKTIDTLNHILNLNINTKPLLDEAKNIQTSLQDLVRHVKVVKEKEERTPVYYA